VHPATSKNKNCLANYFLSAATIRARLLGVLLTHVNKPQTLPKDAVNPKGQENQKNSCKIVQIALPNLKRSGFVLISIYSIFHEYSTQNEVPLFF
jgi:hypothetical protein